MQMTEVFLKVGLNHYLFLSAMMFAVGMLGVLLRKNVIVILMSIELMLNAVNISFIAFNRYLQSDTYNGQVMVFFVMTIAAAEAAIGLALAVMIFKRFKQVNIRFFEHLKG